MKKTIVASVMAAVMLLAGALFTPSHAQSPSAADAPTFYHPVPGTYVNGWPRFTVHYPKDWLETRPRPSQVFAAAVPGPAPNLSLGIVVGVWPPPLEKFTDLSLEVHRAWATDVSLVSDKPAQLRDGTPAREVVLQGTVNGVPCAWLDLATKRSDEMVIMALESRNAKIGEDLKAVAYSLEFQPGFDEPVTVPSDVREFLDEYCSGMVAHDIAKVMSHYSERYLNSGTTKRGVEQFCRQVIGPITSLEIVVTDFVPAGDKAYLSGIVIHNGLKDFLRETSIIKENGEWRWYGNQRDAPPPN